MAGKTNHILRELILGFAVERNVDAFALASGMNALCKRSPKGYRTGQLILFCNDDADFLPRRLGDDSRTAACLLTLFFACHGAPMVSYVDKNDEMPLPDSSSGVRAICEDADFASPIMEYAHDLCVARAGNQTLRRGLQNLFAIDEDTVLVRREFEEECVVAIVHRGKGVRLSWAVLPGFGEYRTWSRLAGDLCTNESDIFLGAGKSVLLISGDLRNEGES